MHQYINALHPNALMTLRSAAKHADDRTEETIDKWVGDIDYPEMHDVNRIAAGILFTKVLMTAGTMIRSVPTGEGLRAWEMVSRVFATTGNISEPDAYTRLGKNKACKTMQDFPKARFAEYKTKLKEYESRFGAVREAVEVSHLTVFSPCRDSLVEVRRQHSDLHADGHIR